MINLQNSLAEFKQAAEQGYQIAKESYDEMSSAIDEAKSELISADRRQSSNNRLENDNNFNKQLREIRNLENQISENLNKLTQEKDNNIILTIVVYGRTNAGKSTLMEILKHGDGKSISSKQRATRDVRSYIWNGLKIFDTPGTCSFEGSEDDNLALMAAAKSDLVLFLLTDDAPQYQEAQRLVDLRKLGIPILGIVNVKQDLNPNRNSEDREIDVEDMKDKINDTNRLGNIVRQFKEMCKSQGCDISDVKFVNTHLLAEFLSQPERENDPALHKLSNFKAVEDFILDKVHQDGSFLRKMNFINKTAIPMQITIAALYSHLTGSIQLWNDRVKNINQLDSWYENFCPSINAKRDNLYSRIETKLKEKITYVVDNYYDETSDRSSNAWKRCIDEIDLENECKNFISGIINTANRKLHELNDRHTQQARGIGGLSFEIPKVYLDDLTDYGDMARLASVGLAFVFPPLAIATGLVSFLFESRSSKINKQKNKLRSALSDSKDDIMAKVKQSVQSILDKDLHGEQVRKFRNALIDQLEIVERLACAQYKIADTINSQYKNLNFKLFVEARQHIGQKNLGEQYYMDEIMIARVVSKEFVIFATNKMPKWECDTLSKLLGGDHVSSFEVSSSNYWQDVKEIIKRDIIGNSNTEFWKQFDGKWGQAIKIEVSRMPSEEVKQIVQQIWSASLIKN